jgi:hypothetical protein
VYFAVIELASVTPDDATRRAFTRFFEDERARLAAVIVVSYGEGFRGAMVRTVLSGILSLAPSFRLGFPRHVVGSVDYAASAAVGVDPSVPRDGQLRAFRMLEATSSRR